MTKSNIKNIIFAILCVFVVAILGSVFVWLGMGWFGVLIKPIEWIPNFVIPIVWTVIYLTLCIILFLWLKNGTLPKKVAILLVLNGIFNILWCLVFFTLHGLLLGNIIIVINAILAFKLIQEIAKENKVYSLVLSIYPIWLCLAFTLNNALWVLN